MPLICVIGAPRWRGQVLEDTLLIIFNCNYYCIVAWYLDQKTKEVMCVCRPVSLSVCLLTFLKKINCFAGGRSPRSSDLHRRLITCRWPKNKVIIAPLVAIRWSPAPLFLLFCSQVFNNKIILLIFKICILVFLKIVYKLTPFSAEVCDLWYFFFIRLHYLLNS